VDLLLALGNAPHTSALLLAELGLLRHQHARSLSEQIALCRAEIRYAFAFGMTQNCV
jgi:hypothetical protein